MCQKVGKETIEAIVEAKTEPKSNLSMSVQMSFII